MSLIRKHFEDRDSWLIGRQELGIGGSDAAAVCGLSPWTSPVELWRIKTGQKKQKDISANAAVERGVRMEPALRELYAAMNPQIRVDPGRRPDGRKRTPRYLGNQNRTDHEKS